MTVINRIGNWSDELKIFFLNVDKLSELRKPGSSLFHIINRNKSAAKNISRQKHLTFIMAVVISFARKLKLVCTI